MISTQVKGDLQRARPRGAPSPRRGRAAPGRDRPIRRPGRALLAELQALRVGEEYALERADVARRFANACRARPGGSEGGTRRAAAWRRALVGEPDVEESPAAPADAPVPERRHLGGRREAPDARDLHGDLARLPIPCSAPDHFQDRLRPRRSKRVPASRLSGVPGVGTTAVRHGPSHRACTRGRQTDSPDFETFWVPAVMTVSLDSGVATSNSTRNAAPSTSLQGRERRGLDHVRDQGALRR